MADETEDEQRSGLRVWASQPISRRSALGLGALGLGLGHLVRPGEARIRWVEARVPTGAAGEPRPEPRPALRVYALGDVGLEGPTRDFTLREMSARMVDRPADAILLLGDNFYPRGVASVQDEQWDTKFERLFPAEIFALPFYACLGNHDHDGNAQAQVEYTRRSTRWRMPKSYHGFSRDLGAGARADFFLLDTQRIWKDHDPGSPQLRWLEQGLARSDARWKIVVGHHCIRSGGEHGRFSGVARHLEPIFARHEVDLYVSGHDHDLQLLRSGEGWLQLVSGAGSALRRTAWTVDSLFAESKPGFAMLALQPEELRIEFHVACEGLVHAHTLHKQPSRTADAAPAD